MVRTNSLFTMFLVWLTTIIIGFTWMVNANDDNCVITWPVCEPSGEPPGQDDPWGDEEAKDNYRRSTDPDNPNLYTDEDGCTWVSRGMGATRICPQNDSDDDGTTNDGPVEEPVTICYDTEWGSWYVDTIHSVNVTFHSHSSNYVVAGHPVHGLFSVVTRYSERRDGHRVCEVYQGDDLIDSYHDPDTEKRGPRSTTEFQKIALVDPFDDLHILSMNEETGEVILQWKERHTAYRMQVDVTLFEGSTRSSLVVQNYQWPSRGDTNSVEVRSIHENLQ